MSSCTPEEILRLATWRASSCDGFLGVGQRQQVVEIFAAGVAPAGVLGNQRGFETRDGALHARQVLAVDAVGRTQAESHAVQAERVVSARALAARAPRRRPRENSFRCAPR